MSKVSIVGSTHGFSDMFKKRGWEVTANITSADLIQFTGGSDVSPYLYGEALHPTTHNDQQRDIYESKIFKLALLKGIPMAGVCRGGQFLHVMNGGSLWQDIPNHAIWGTHKAYRGLGDPSFDVTSTHHQSMREMNNGGKVILRAPALGLYHRMGVSGIISEECEDSIEAMYYKDNKCFCFQPHPEFENAPECCTNYYFLKLWELFGLE